MEKVLIWLSGWVDSAVSAYLLKEQWYNVVAGFMKNYVDEDNPNCSTYQDAKEAIRVAEFLWLEIISFDLRKEYEERIVEYIYDGYKKWITPNPDILCNNLIKFDVFLEKAMELWFNKIAMWHYARIQKGNLENIPPLQMRTTQKYKLLRWADYNKDQSYFLSRLNQYQLSKSLFPIWDITKHEVRKIAQKIWLPNADRKDSQWLCFIGKVPMKEFLKKRLWTKKWDIILSSWKKVWEHDGAYLFTVGQSRGLDINKKAYIVKTDIEKNQVIVSYDKLEGELLSNEIFVEDWHRIGDGYILPLKCETKIRYRQEPNKATMMNEKWKIKFSYDKDQWWIAKWQSLVAYIWEECIGSGIIA